MPTHPFPRIWAARAIPLLAAALLVACGGGGGAAPAAPQSAPAPETLRTAQAGELLDYFKARIVQRNAQQLDWVFLDGPVAALANAGAAGSAPAMSGTTVQVDGVDEDDLLKSDGTRLFALHPSTGRLETRAILPDGGLGSPQQVALRSDVYVSGMHLSEDARRVAVLGTRQAGVSLEVFDAAPGAAPVRSTQVLIDGYPVATRRIGNVLYVASVWTPDLNAYWWPRDTPADQVQTKLSTLTTSALLPGIRVGDKPAVPLVREQECHMQSANLSPSLQITTITAFDLSSTSLDRRSTCFVGNGETMYMSTTAAYLTTSRNYWFGMGLLPPKSSTDVHKFALQGMEVAYRGSAEVPGHLGWDREKMPYRMSEHEGDLRVVTFTGETGWVGPVASTVPQAPSSPATLTVLREERAAGKLVRMATLPNAQRPAPLGHAGEQVYAVQFAGPLAYVVTFRRTDPLYVLDLSNPADPKAAGELAAPGYSDYLFPLADGKLLGIGRSADDNGFVQGLKVALFDVADPARPSLLSSRTLGDRGTMSALDYSSHGVNLFRQGSQTRIALPVQVVDNTSGVMRPTKQGLARYVVDTAAGTLEERNMVVATTFGSDAYQNPYWFTGLGNERSLQSTRATYYLWGGQVTVVPEP